MISYISTYVKVDCDSDDPDNCFCNTGSGRCLRLKAGGIIISSGPSCRLMALVVSETRCSTFVCAGGNAWAGASPVCCSSAGMAETWRLRSSGVPDHFAIVYTASGTLMDAAT